MFVLHSIPQSWRHFCFSLLMGFPWIITLKPIWLQRPHLWQAIERSFTNKMKHFIYRQLCWGVITYLPSMLLMLHGTKISFSASRKCLFVSSSTLLVKVGKFTYKVRVHSTYILGRPNTYSYKRLSKLTQSSQTLSLGINS